MGLKESLRLALEGLSANKMRAVLTMLGIIIGIAAVIGILTVGDALSGSITGTMSSMGASSISISLQERDSSGGAVSMLRGSSSTPEASDLITTDMLDEMRSRYGGDIAAVSLSESAGSGQARDGRLYANVSVTGVNEEYFTADSTELLAGRFLRETDSDGERMVCVASDRLVNNMFGGDTDAALGSTIAVELSDEICRFRIVGVYEYEASAMGISTASEQDVTTSLYIPLSTAKRISGADEGFSSITVQAAAGTDGAAVAQELENFLNRYYSRNEDYSVYAMSMDSMIESVNSIMDTLSIAISVIAAISLLVGGIGVMNIMLVSVTERTREIGTRKALGATNANIRIQFVVESAIICLIGGIIGIVLGGAIGLLGSSLLSEATFPSVGSVALAVGFSLAVGVFFGYYPANKAAQMDPIEALRYE